MWILEPLVSKSGRTLHQSYIKTQTDLVQLKQTSSLRQKKSSGRVSFKSDHNCDIYSVNNEYIDRQRRSWTSLYRFVVVWYNLRWVYLNFFWTLQTSVQCHNTMYTVWCRLYKIIFLLQGINMYVPKLKNLLKSVYTFCQRLAALFQLAVFLQDFA